MRTLSAAIAVGMISLCACLLLCGVAAVANPAPALQLGDTTVNSQIGITITQGRVGDAAGLWIDNDNSKELIAICADQRGGTFIAFYDHKHRQKGDWPRLAISAHGLQLTGADGKPQTLTVDELLALKRRPE